jgi:curved DNA-binding protein CbpA
VTEERDPYKVLGVPSTASEIEIREAYRARARRLHPDLVGEQGLDDMRALNQAWAVLKDPEKRATFDTAHGYAPPSSTGGSAGDGSSGVAAGAGSRSGQTGDLGSQPHWTGAAGPPPGRPWGSVIGFGIYAGWSLGEIIRRDRGYLTWLRDRAEGKKYRQEIDHLLEIGAQDQAPTKERKRK